MSAGGIVSTVFTGGPPSSVGDVEVPSSLPQANKKTNPINTAMKAVTQEVDPREEQPKTNIKKL
jgi:hypothetical protein